MDLEEYRESLMNDLRIASSQNQSDPEDEFLNYVLQLLVNFNEYDSPKRVNMGDKRGRGGRIMHFDGYAVDDVDNSLTLFISDFQNTTDIDKLTTTRVDELYWRIYYFLDETCNGSINDYFDDSDDILTIAKFIKNGVYNKNDVSKEFSKIKFAILTNKELDRRLLTGNLFADDDRCSKKKVKKTRRIKKEDFNGKPLEIALWHIESFFDMENSDLNQPIVINFEEEYENNGIPCLEGNIGDDVGYTAYLGIIPARILAQIYLDYGSRVLEGNVRAFLGTSGAKSVNSGIKKTINNDPTKFFTYNNGIATTASEVKIKEIDGQKYITEIVDLQIINGGQTTATLAEAVRKKTNLELKGIFVPVKVTVIEDRTTEDDEGIRIYDKMVQDIAKYANSQNKVTAADLFSNHPFHIEMEKLSKNQRCFTSKAIQTGWYYERARKKYKQESSKGNKDDRRRFEAKYPKNQVITKEQLAVYMTALGCEPHIVAKGKNWTMKYFANKVSELMKKDKRFINELYYKRAVAAAIIYRTVDGYLEENKDSVKRPTGFWYKAGGYKGDIVPYTVAKILSAIPNDKVLDLDDIWEKQEVSKAFMREIEIVTKLTNDFILQHSGSMIVTEYCKKESTWEIYRDEIPYMPSMSFLGELIPVALDNEKRESFAKNQAKNNEDKLICSMIGKGYFYWEEVMKMGIDTRLLRDNEINALEKVIRMAKTGNVPMSRSGALTKETKMMLELIKCALEKLDAEGLLKENEASL